MQSKFKNKKKILRQKYLFVTFACHDIINKNFNNFVCHKNGSFILAHIK